MKAQIIVLAVAICSLLSACASAPQKAEEETIVLGELPQQGVILLQNTTNGNLACCRDTEYSSAEECAKALEAECYVRVQDLPYRPAKYDFLTKDTYPTRRWREHETAPRW